MLDNIDKQIIDKLSKNGRLSLTELSEGTGISRVAVASRIEKLEKSGLLKVCAALNLEKLNYQTLLVELQIEKTKTAAFKKLVESNPRILHCFEITGPFNHLLICSARNNQTLRSFIENELKKFAKDCRVTLSSNPLTPTYVPIKSLEGEW
ncbi:MAG: Lrp/AsnC family transcriptional regulator [Candidatus Nanoarchaeia archaeon]